MRLSSRRTAWVLAAFALLLVLTSCAFLTFSCCHACTGADCPVCMQVRLWHSVLRLFGALILCMGLSPAVAAGLSVVRHARVLSPRRRTPVTLKTKLLN